jgi:hypothetical protein
MGTNLNILAACTLLFPIASFTSSCDKLREAAAENARENEIARLKSEIKRLSEIERQNPKEPVVSVYLLAILATQAPERIGGPEAKLIHDRLMECDKYQLTAYIKLFTEISYKHDINYQNYSFCDSSMLAITKRLELMQKAGINVVKYLRDIPDDPNEVTDKFNELIKKFDHGRTTQVHQNIEARSWVKIVSAEPVSNSFTMSL